MWGFNLPDFLKYKEAVEIMDAIDSASYQDQEATAKASK